MEVGTADDGDGRGGGKEEGDTAITPHKWQPLAFLPSNKKLTDAKDCTFRPDTLKVWVKFKKNVSPVPILCWINPGSELHSK